MAGTERARKLRRASTDAERRLWYALRNRQISGHKFRRQHPIGPYIVDFVCPAKKLVVELDGSQHLRSVDYDNKRTAEIAREGFRVIRFWNNEVLSNLDGVLRAIEANLMSGSNAPHPGPLPGGERES
ncbi:MAG: endonuclease domain-containing protein [Kiloniellales bacterium]|nr:endonuclease domain-containing protein [Kiloniellales bacterium]